MMNIDQIRPLKKKKKKKNFFGSKIPKNRMPRYRRFLGIFFNLDNRMSYPYRVYDVRLSKPKKSEKWHFFANFRPKILVGRQKKFVNVFTYVN